MANAAGGEMAVRGCVSINARTKEEEFLRLPFLDSDVSMPMISAAQLTDSGEHEVNIRKRGGTIVNVETQQTSNFIKRAGVYFVKLLVEQPGKQEPDRFGRPSLP